MPRVELPNKRMFDERPDSVRVLVRPLALNPQGLEIRWQPYKAGRQVLSVYDHFSRTRSLRERTFKTRVDGVLCQYLEHWLPDQSYATWHLEHACLHLFATEVSGDARHELMALHSEPQQPLTTHAGKAKGSPHVHLKIEQGRLKPLARSHFPLNYGHLDEVLQTIDTLHDALGDAVTIVVEEVLCRLDSA